MFLYCVRDRVAQDTASIFESKNDGTDLRSVAQLFSDPKAPDSADYELLVLGSIEHEDPVSIELYTPPRVINIPRNVQQVTRPPDLS